jgi:hypothetical protein
MPRHRPILSIVLGCALSIPSLAAMAQPAGNFDGAYQGQMAQAPSGLSSSSYTSPPCISARPVAMSVRAGYVMVYYSDWKGHWIHYKGRVAADGSVKAWHRNRNGVGSPLTGNISGNQFTADITRGHCDYTITLTKG